ncbi:MAG: hypothetical protein FJX76_24205 [Armatimonadetes bacterium]|nr:hypothetical protein [Armatimonadota bacterium]
MQAASAQETGPQRITAPGLLLETRKASSKADNVILIHDVGATSGAWSTWLKRLKTHDDERMHPHRVYTYEYDTSLPLDTAVADLARLIMARREEFVERQLTLVGHGKGGLIAKAFTWKALASKLSASGRDFRNMRLIYLDVPHRGIPANPYIPWDADKDLRAGYSQDPGAILPAFNVVVPRSLSETDVLVQMTLPAVGAVKLRASAIPYASATFAAATLIETPFKDLRPRPVETRYHERPPVTVVYQDWHGALLRSREACDLVFGKLLNLEVARFKAAVLLTRSQIEDVYRDVLRRKPTAEEMRAAGPLTVDNLKDSLLRSVEYAARDASPAAFAQAWRRNGGEGLLGIPSGPPVAIPSGGHIMVLNTPDATLKALTKRPQDEDAYLMQGAIAAEYLLRASAPERYGLPTGDESRFGGEIRQKFEKGDMVYSPATDQVEFQFAYPQE